MICSLTVSTSPHESSCRLSMTIIFLALLLSTTRSSGLIPPASTTIYLRVPRYLLTRVVFPEPLTPNIYAVTFPSSAVFRSLQAFFGFIKQPLLPEAVFPICTNLLFSLFNPGIDNQHPVYISKGACIQPQRAGYQAPHAATIFILL